MRLKRLDLSKLYHHTMNTCHSFCSGSALPFSISPRDTVQPLALTLLSRYSWAAEQRQTACSGCFQAVICPPGKGYAQIRLTNEILLTLFLKHTVDVCFPCYLSETHWTVDTVRTYLQGTETYFALISIPQISSKNP